MQTKKSVADRWWKGVGYEVLAETCERALLVGTRDAIRLLGGAEIIWDRCLAAGWIRAAVRAGRIHYYHYGDIAALAERLCRDGPPGFTSIRREEADYR